MNEIVRFALESTVSYTATRENELSLHEVLASASTVYARMKVSMDEQKGYNRLIGAMSSDKSRSDWFVKLSRLSEYCKAFQYTSGSMIIVPASSLSPSPELAHSRYPKPARRLKPTKGGGSKYKQRYSRTPGSLTTTPSTKPPPPPQPDRSAPIPIPKVGLYSATKPKEQLDLLEIDNFKGEKEDFQNRPETPMEGESDNDGHDNDGAPASAKKIAVKVPAKFLSSPYAESARSGRRKANTISVARGACPKYLEELFNPTNFTHLRTCEACRIKAQNQKAANRNQVSSPKHAGSEKTDRSRSHSPPSTAGKKKVRASKRGVSKRFLFFFFFFFNSSPALTNEPHKFPIRSFPPVHLQFRRNDAVEEHLYRPRRRPNRPSCTPPSRTFSPSSQSHPSQKYSRKDG